MPPPSLLQIVLALFVVCMIGFGLLFLLAKPYRKSGRGPRTLVFLALCLPIGYFIYQSVYVDSYREPNREWDTATALFDDEYVKSVTVRYPNGFETGTTDAVEAFFNDHTAGPPPLIGILNQARHDECEIIVSMPTLPGNQQLERANALRDVFDCRVKVEKPLRSVRIS